MEDKNLIERIVVPRHIGDITYTGSAFGSGTYEEIGKQILEKGHRVPTGDLSISLIHAAYFDDTVKNTLDAKNIRDILEMKVAGKGGYAIYNRNICTFEGVYVVQDEGVQGVQAPFNIEEIEDNLLGGDTELGVRFSQDRKVRFAPRSSFYMPMNSYRRAYSAISHHTHATLECDGLVIASFGPEGAKQLAEISSVFNGNPRIGNNFSSTGETGQITKGVTYLGTSSSEDKKRNSIFLNLRECFSLPFAFGVTDVDEFDSSKERCKNGK
jgi:hypothetical protein